MMSVSENIDLGGGSESILCYRVAGWDTTRDLVVSGTSYRSKGELVHHLEKHQANDVRVKRHLRI